MELMIKLISAWTKLLYVNDWKMLNLNVKLINFLTFPIILNLFGALYFTVHINYLYFIFSVNYKIIITT